VGLGGKGRIQPLSPEPVKHTALVTGKSTYSEQKTPLRTVDIQHRVVMPDDITPLAGVPHATVTAGSGTKLCIEYQTLETSCSVSVPVRDTPEAIQDGFAYAWEVVKDQLDRQADWGRDVMQALVDIKRNSERR
jgi:hypothetical protein